MSIDSMRSGAGQQGNHPFANMAQAAPTADYRSSSLFSHYGAYGGAKASPPPGEGASYGNHQPQEQHYGHPGSSN